MGWEIFLENTKICRKLFPQNLCTILNANVAYFVIVWQRTASLEGQVRRGNSLLRWWGQLRGLDCGQASCRRGPQPSQKSGPIAGKETPATAHLPWTQQKAWKQPSQLGSRSQEGKGRYHTVGKCLWAQVRHPLRLLEKKQKLWKAQRCHYSRKEISQRNIYFFCHWYNQSFIPSLEKGNKRGCMSSAHSLLSTW